jgi:hypothetical protein
MKIYQWKPENTGAVDAHFSGAVQNEIYGACYSTV